MEADLSTVTLLHVLRDLADTATTGSLVVTGSAGQGVVSMSDGLIVAAASPAPIGRLGDRLVGAGRLTSAELDEVVRTRPAGDEHVRLGALLVERGLASTDAVRLFLQEQALDALFDLASWRDGHTHLEPTNGAAVTEVAVRLRVDDAIAEVARRQREWTTIKRAIPDLRLIPEQHGGAGGDDELEPDERAVLALIDGHRSIDAIAFELGFGSFDTARIVHALAMAEQVRLRSASDDDQAASVTGEHAAQAYPPPPPPTSPPAARSAPPPPPPGAAESNAPLFGDPGGTAARDQPRQPVRRAAVTEILRELNQLATTTDEQPLQRTRVVSVSARNDEARRRRGRGNA